MDDVCEGVRRQRLDHYVDVVGHYDPGDQPIAIAVEFEQCVLYASGETQITQVAGGVTGVEV
jgi:hypothetical protein